MSFPDLLNLPTVSFFVCGLGGRKNFDLLCQDIHFHYRISPKRNQEYQNKPKTTEEFSTHRANWDELVGVVHHGDEEVEQDDDVDDGEGAEHDEAPEPRELLDPGELEVVQVYEAESRPEQGLWCLPEAAIIQCSELIKLPLISNQIESIKLDENY